MRNPETAKRLDEAMKDIDISAKDLSDKSGVPQSSISQYLSGLFAPKNQTAKKLADVLGVNPMWLMNFEGEPKHRIEEHFDFYLTNVNDPIEIDSVTELKAQTIQRLFAYMKRLNTAGIEKLIDRAKELEEVPKYRMDKGEMKPVGKAALS